MSVAYNATWKVTSKNTQAMKSLSLLLALTLTSALPCQEKPNAEKVLEKARLEAVESGRNLFVHIGAPW